MGKAMGLNQVHAAVHVLVVAVSLTLSFAQFDNSLFAWHPIFMSLGYILFMTEGVLSALSFRSLEGGAERVQAIQGHALLQLRAVVCICLGFGVIFRNKARDSTQT